MIPVKIITQSEKKCTLPVVECPNLVTTAPAAATTLFLIVPLFFRLRPGLFPGDHFPVRLHDHSTELPFIFSWTAGTARSPPTSFIFQIVPLFFCGKSS